MNLTREKLLVAKVNMVNSILFYTLCQVKKERYEASTSLASILVLKIKNSSRKEEKCIDIHLNDFGNGTVNISNWMVSTFEIKLRVSSYLPQTVLSE